MSPVQILEFIGAFWANPAFWWMWESVGLFLFFMVRWSRSLGSNKQIILEPQNGGWHKVGERWVKKGAKTWGKLKGRMNQPSAVLYTEDGFLSSHGVILTDINHTLPMKVSLEIVPHNPVGKYSKTKEGNVKFTPGPGYSVNPDIKAMEEHLGRETAKQLHSLNALGSNSVAMLVICVAMGLLGGILLGQFIFPTPHVVTQATITTVTQTVSH